MQIPKPTIGRACTIQPGPGPDQAALCGVDLVRLLVATACPVWRSSAHGGKPSTGRQRA
jgi:hypothetical protein